MTWHDSQTMIAVDAALCSGLTEAAVDALIARLREVWDGRISSGGMLTLQDREGGAMVRDLTPAKR